MFANTSRKELMPAEVMCSVSTCLGKTSLSNSVLLQQKRRCAFGHNMLPASGLAGLGVAFGGSVEYQQNWNPHFHGNVHTASVYQHKTMTEIAEMMESNLLTFEALATVPKLDAS